MNNNEQDTQLLLEKLSALAKKGPIVSRYSGSNAIGKTLQEELGITHSTKSRNSLYNYTVTSTSSKQNSGRTNLFACVPNWSESKLTSSFEHVMTNGREAPEKNYKKALFCTLSSLGPNSFGLFLKVNQQTKILEEWINDGTAEYPILKWDTEKLLKKIEALGKSAIVTGLPVNLKGQKAFNYRYVEILEKPNPANFLQLIDEGTITMDHCISLKEGSSTAREQGPLFKIPSSAREELYGPIQRYDLLEL